MVHIMPFVLVMVFYVTPPPGTGGIVCIQQASCTLRAFAHFAGRDQGDECDVHRVRGHPAAGVWCAERSDGRHTVDGPG